MTELYAKYMACIFDCFYAVIQYINVALDYLRQMIVIDPIRPVAKYLIDLERERITPRFKLRHTL